MSAVLPATPLAAELGFQPLPGAFFAVLITFVVVSPGLIDAVKGWFFRRVAPPAPPVPRPVDHDRRVHRRASRFGVVRREGHGPSSVGWHEPDPGSDDQSSTTSVLSR